MKNKKTFLLLLLVPIIIFFIGRSFSLPHLEEVRSVEIQSDSYAINTPGSWHIDKSAEWIGFGKARVTFDVNSIMKPMDNKNKDIIVVIDISGSMAGEKLNKAISDTIELTEWVLNNQQNSMALIVFDSLSEIKTTFTHDKNEMLELLNNLREQGTTDYNLALENVDVVMQDYIKKEDTDLITLFLTDGYPNEDTPNEVATYHMLKEKYPYMEINGIQYEMGKDIIQEIKNISDRQWVADRDTLHNVLFDASAISYAYEKYEVIDFINDEYFYVNSVDDINVTSGSVLVEEEDGIQKVIWDLDNKFTTGFSISMSIDLNLKEEYRDTAGFYPTNKRERISSKIIDEDEQTVNSELTPILKNYYYVVYDENEPNGCSLPDLEREIHFVYQNVEIKKDILSCTGHIFKGWEIIDEYDDIERINNNYFIMPNHDVTIRAVWTTQNITKSMTGKVVKKEILYNMMKRTAEEGVYAKEYVGEHNDSIDTTKSTEKIYHWYAANTTDGNSIAREILNKNNVIFANYCWQILRTTDTGGVKLLYNGEPERGKCLNTRGQHRGFQNRNYKTLRSDYWYGTDYTYNSSTKKYSISGELSHVAVPYRERDTYVPPLIGKFTCLSTNKNNECAVLYYIDAVYDGGESYGDAYVFSLGVTAHYSSIGAASYNAIDSSPGYYGYMHNTIYPHRSDLSYTEKMYDSYTTLKTSYYYSYDVEFDESLQKYELKNMYYISSSDQYPSLKGKYTTSYNYNISNSWVMYIGGVRNSTMYYISLHSGHDLAYYNATYQYGSDYTENSDGTYTISSPTTFDKSDWLAHYELAKNKYICKLDEDGICRTLWYVANTSSDSFRYVIVKTIKYSNSFSYDGEKYILDDNSVSFWNNTLSTNKNKLKTHHYTCFNESGICEKVYYVYAIYTDDSIFSIELTNGESVQDALNAMLYNDDVNRIDSTAKFLIDWWYKENIYNNFDDYLEDTVFCNNRNIKDYGGWNPNGGDNSQYLYFQSLDSLYCLNETDRFSISNSKAKLTYKVALPTVSEMSLLNNYNIRKNGIGYHLMSPFHFDTSYGQNRYINTSGYLEYYYSMGQTSAGIRPVVSLRPGIEYKYGDGSMEHPYQIDDGTS